MNIVGTYLGPKCCTLEQICDISGSNVSLLELS
jgi:hypothetical protein